MRNFMMITVFALALTAQAEERSGNLTGEISSTIQFGGIIGFYTSLDFRWFQIHRDDMGLIWSSTPDEFPLFLNCSYKFQTNQSTQEAL